MHRKLRASAAERRRAIESRIAELATRQHGVVSRSQLIALGLSRGTIDRRVADGRLRRLFPGVYGAGPIMPPRAGPMAAILACGPHAVVSHATAAELFGLGEPAAGGHVDVTVPLPCDRRHAGVRVHRVSRLEPDERTLYDGIPTTTPARTLADLASVLAAADLERAIARAEREGLVRAEELDALTRRNAGRAGATRLAAVLGSAGGPRFTRSEAEARFLELVRRARLPAPRVNCPFAGYEVDFLWPEQNVAVEVDGFRYHGSRARFESDRRRNAHLASLGIQVIPLTWRQVVDDGVATVVQIAQALARRG